MSKIIEIIGPPGVGKTTIYKELTRRWVKEYNWAPKSEFMPKVSKSKFGMTDYWIIQARKMLAKPLYDDKILLKASYKFLKENPDFVSLCWKLITNNRQRNHLDVDNRFRSAYHLYPVLGTYQYIVDSADPRLCITDELLIHRIILVTNEKISSNDISLFSRYVPLPYALILLDAPADVIAQRSMERKRNIIIHENRSIKELIKLAEVDREKLKITTNKLQQKGVKILSIDTTKPISNVLKVLLTFLENIRASQN